MRGPGRGRPCESHLEVVAQEVLCLRLTPPPCCPKDAAHLRCFFRPTFYAKSLKPLFRQFQWVLPQILVDFPSISIDFLSFSITFIQFQSDSVDVNHFQSV